MDLALAKQLFDYQPLTGQLLWKVRHATCIRVGSVAGTLNKTGGGYYRTKVSGKLYSNHRIVWLLHYGTLPKLLDHIDRNPMNNRIENLRPASVSQNAANKRKQSAKTRSKWKGVAWYQGNAKPWAARIRLNGKLKVVGWFADECDAALAYNFAAFEAFGEFAHYNEAI